VETEVRPDNRRRSRPPRRRRQEILEAAAGVFHEKGYKATSIQDIADAVGILKGSLYYYITSKEDLLFEILQDVHQQGLQNLDRIDRVPGTPLQKIRAFVTVHVTHNAENLVKMAVFFHDFRSLSPVRREIIVAERDLYDQHLRRLIAAAQQDGSVCPDLDPKLTSIEILGMMNWIYHWYRPGGSLSVSALADSMADFVVAGLVCDPATHRPGHRASLAPVPPIPPAAAAPSDGAKSNARAKRASSSS
jgi:AcrR family transcriptional regulator